MYKFNKLTNTTQDTQIGEIPYTAHGAQIPPTPYF